MWQMQRKCEGQRKPERDVKRERRNTSTTRQKRLQTGRNFKRERYLM